MKTYETKYGVAVGALLAFNVVIYGMILLGM